MRKRSVPRTRAEWEIQAAILATGGPKTWGTNWAAAGLTGSFSTRAAAAAGSMYGSPYLSQFSDQTGTPCRLVQHGVSTEAIFNEIVADTGLVQFEVAPTTNGALVALNRNGYLSLADGGGSNTRIRCSVIRAWIPSLNMVMEFYPFSGAAPQPYPF